MYTRIFFLCRSKNTCFAYPYLGADTSFCDNDISVQCLLLIYQNQSRPCHYFICCFLVYRRKTVITFGGYRTESDVLSNATGITLFHNHPSCSPKPSREDIDITVRL
nr:JAB domain-containing protein [uncultured Acetobacterium sp.]